MEAIVAQEVEANITEHDNQDNDITESDERGVCVWGGGETSDSIPSVENSFSIISKEIQRQ